MSYLPPFVVMIGGLESHSVVYDGGCFLDLSEQAFACVTLNVVSSGMC